VIGIELGQRDSILGHSGADCARGRGRHLKRKQRPDGVDDGETEPVPKPGLCGRAVVREQRNGVDLAGGPIPVFSCRPIQRAVDLGPTFGDAGMSPFRDICSPALGSAKTIHRNPAEIARQTTTLQRDNARALVK